MIGYVVRDKFYDALCFHTSLPFRNIISDAWWHGINDEWIRIGDNDFPQFKNLKWEDNSVKVEMTIKILEK